MLRIVVRVVNVVEVVEVLNVADIVHFNNYNIYNNFNLFFIFACLFYQEQLLKIWLKNNPKHPKPQSTLLL